MSDMKVNCPHCNQSLEVPQEMLGHVADCPTCSKAIQLPAKQPQKPAYTPARAPSSRAALQAPPPSPKPEAPDTQPCPFCGESILRIARKCKHCGEFLDPTLRHQKEKQSVPQIVQIARPPKSRAIYVILGLFLGGLVGLHNFYAGRYLQGVVQLVIMLLLGWVIIGFVINVPWVLIELLVVTKDGNGNEMQ